MAAGGYANDATLRFRQRGVSGTEEVTTSRDLLQKGPRGRAIQRGSSAGHPRSPRSRPINPEPARLDRYMQDLVDT